MKKVILMLSLMFCVQSMNAALEACQTIGSTIVTTIVNAGSSAIKAVAASPGTFVSCLGAMSLLNLFSADFSRDLKKIKKMELISNQQNNVAAIQDRPYSIGNSYHEIIGSSAYCVDKGTVFENGLPMSSKSLQTMSNAYIILLVSAASLKALCCYGLYTVFAK